MANIFEEVKEMQEVKTKVKKFCTDILVLYNKYTENKINTEGELGTVKISKTDNNLVCVKYGFIRDFGSYVLNDPNNEGDRRWEENLQVVEETINFPENIFLGLIQSEEYSLEYVEEEIKNFVEQEMAKFKEEECREKLFSSFKSSILNLNYG